LLEERREERKEKMPVKISRIKFIKPNDATTSTVKHKIPNTNKKISAGIGYTICTI
jgi:hypothetical protein